MLKFQKKDALNRQVDRGKQTAIILKFQKSDAALLYSTLLSSALLYSTLLFSILYSTLLYSTLHFRIGPALLPEQKQEQEQEQEQDQEQEQEQDVLLLNYFSTILFVFLE